MVSDVVHDPKRRSSHANLYYLLVPLGGPLCIPLFLLMAFISRWMKNATRRIA